MKLTHITIHEVVVPAHPGRVNSDAYGPAVFDETSKFIIEAHTDEGIIGLGETLRGVSEAALRSAFAQLKGLDLKRVCFQEPPVVDLSANDMFAHEHPDRPNRLAERFFGTYADLGIHATLLDLLGKKAQLPVHALMGGAYRHRVPVAYWMGRMTPQDSACVCKQARDQGYTSVKCKCALEDDNVERAEAVYEACGADFKMTFDPNQRFYRYGEAIPMLKRLGEVGNVECVEDPFPTADIESYRLLRRHGLFSLAMHLSYSPQLIQAIRAQACDYINLGDLPWNVHLAGGVCWLANIPTWHGSGVDLGILEALYLHVCAVTKSMTLPSDILGCNIRQHNLVTNPFTVEDGTITLPTSPGLGVELDHEALEQYAIRHFSITC